MMLDGGVAQISRSRTVPATPRQVWDVLADFGAISSWAANVDHSCLLEHGSGDPGVGTSRRLQVGRDALALRGHLHHRVHERSAAGEGLRRAGDPRGVDPDPRDPQR